MDLPWDVLVTLTAQRLSHDAGEEIAHGVDFVMAREANGHVRYTALTSRGDRALRLMQAAIAAEILS